MLKKMFLATICVCALRAAAEEQIDNRVYECSFVNAGDFKVDGKLDEALWEKIPSSGNFFVLRSFKEGWEKTTFKAVWTKEAVCFAVNCAVVDPKRLKAEAEDNGKLWEDDGIEIFVVPDAAKKDRTYFQFISNTRGKRYNGTGGQQTSLAPWKCGVERTPKGYTMEIEIPFACLEKTPGPGDIWRFDMCRNSLPADDKVNYTWSLIAFDNSSSGWCDPAFWGFLRFADKISVQSEGSVAELISFYKRKSYLKRGHKLLDEVKKTLDGAPDELKNTPALKNLRKKFEAETASLKKLDESSSVEAAEAKHSELDAFEAQTRREIKQLMLDGILNYPAPDKPGA